MFVENRRKLNFKLVSSLTVCICWSKFLYSGEKYASASRPSCFVSIHWTCVKFWSWRGSSVRPIMRCTFQWLAFSIFLKNEIWYFQRNALFSASFGFLRCWEKVNVRDNYSKQYACSGLLFWFPWLFGHWNLSQKFRNRLRKTPKAELFQNFRVRFAIRKNSCGTELEVSLQPILSSTLLHLHVSEKFSRAILKMESNKNCCFDWIWPITRRFQNRSWKQKILQVVQELFLQIGHSVMWNFCLSSY